jgi:hypothetical protein
MMVDMAMAWAESTEQQRQAETERQERSVTVFRVTCTPGR